MKRGRAIATGDDEAGPRAASTEPSARPAPPLTDALLRDEVEHLRRIAAHAPDYILELDRRGVITYMNRPAPGRSMQQMIGSDVRVWMQPEAHPDFERALREVFEQGRPASYESRGAVTSTHYIHRMSPVSAEGVVRWAVLITHDVTALKASEAALLELEQRYRALVDASFHGWVVAVRGVIVEVNASCARMFGRTREEMLGQSSAAFLTPESFALAEQKLRARNEEVYELRGLRADGSEFPLQIVSRNVTWRGERARVSGLRDLTTLYRESEEQARREEQVRRAQKLETLGVLAGGIAHDFNNLLAVVLANGELLAHAGGDPGRLARGLEQIRAAALRGGELVEQLLAYAGRRERATRRVDLNALISDTTELLRVSISKKARLQYVLDPELPSIDVDPAQLQQVLMNLITNASDALDGEAGSIKVRTAVYALDAGALGRCITADEAGPGRYVALEVEDSGAGMAPATIQRIFDPFFTTKEKGRGLGLASVLGIVRAHRGAISVRSDRGQGTAFSVYLPVSPSAAAEASASATSPASLRPAAGEPRAADGAAATTGALVLIAEDEPLLARATREILELEGYRVLLGVDGRQALDLYRAHLGEVRVALLDVTMPQMGGLELAAELRKLEPSQPIVLMSGYVHDAAAAGDGRDPYRILRKPFLMADLLGMVREAAAGEAPR